MIPEDAATAGQRNVFKLVVYSLLVFAPICYLGVVYAISQTQPAPPNDTDAFLFYPLLILALVGPSVAPIVERVQIAVYKKGGFRVTSEIALYQTVLLPKLAMVEACYIFGLTMFFITRETHYLYYFYPIGIVWTIIRWPTEEKYRAFQRKLQEP